MKSSKKIIIRRAKNKFLKEIRRNKRKSKALKKKKSFTGNLAELKHFFLSKNLKHISNCSKTKILKNDFLTYNKVIDKVVYQVPEIFSLIEKPDESYGFIEKIINTIYNNRAITIEIDYQKCKTIHLGAQIYLDILLRDIFECAKKLSDVNQSYSILKTVRPINIENDNVKKLINSIGSYAILTNRRTKYNDIVPYPLCEFKTNPKATPLFNIETKERHTTELIEYIIESLGRVEKELTPESIENLSIIIGEILINAEEHSSNKHRFSIGYFQEYNNSEGGHYGIFNLAILNFGDTIYDKFKNPNCPRKDVVQKMKSLSEQYTKSNFFSSKIKEETLWTLYALQDAVTSVSPEKNIKRGNGSIKFIESFFNLKGENGGMDKISRLAILSGNTSILFDGRYIIKEIDKEGEKFKVMTFNDEGDISKKPDEKYVKFVDNYFPGTIISAQILISKDDLV